MILSDEEDRIKEGNKSSMVIYLVIIAIMSISMGLIIVLGISVDGSARRSADENKRIADYHQIVAQSQNLPVMILATPIPIKGDVSVTISYPKQSWQNIHQWVDGMYNTVMQIKDYR